MSQSINTDKSSSKHNLDQNFITKRVFSPVQLSNHLTRHLNHFVSLCPRIVNPNKPMNRCTKHCAFPTVSAVMAVCGPHRKVPIRLLTTRTRNPTISKSRTAPLPTSIFFFCYYSLVFFSSLMLSGCILNFFLKI